MPDDRPQPGEIYFEFTAIGRSVKVTAIDAVTGIEVTIVGPAKASQPDLQRVATQKLMARLKANGLHCSNSAVPCGQIDR